MALFLLLAKFFSNVTNVMNVTNVLELNFWPVQKMLFPLHHQIPLHWHNYKPPPLSIYFHDMILSWEVFCTGFHDPGSGCPSSWPWKKEGGLTQPQVPAQLFTKFQPTPPPPMPPLPLHHHLIFTGYRKKTPLGRLPMTTPMLP